MANFFLVINAHNATLNVKLVVSLDLVILAKMVSFYSPMGNVSPAIQFVKLA